MVLWNQLKVESNREHPLNSSQCLKLTFGSGLPHDQEDENILVTKILFGLYIICVCMQVLPLEFQVFFDGAVPFLQNILGLFLDHLYWFCLKTVSVFIWPFNISTIGTSKKNGYFHDR